MSKQALMRSAASLVAREKLFVQSYALALPLQEGERVRRYR